MTPSRCGRRGAFPHCLRSRRDVVTGPATDNRVGARFVESLGLPACNARTNPKQLGDLVINKFGRISENRMRNDAVIFVHRAMGR